MDKLDLVPHHGEVSMMDCLMCRKEQVKMIKCNMSDCEAEHEGFCTLNIKDCSKILLTEEEYKATIDNNHKENYCIKCGERKALEGSDYCYYCDKVIRVLKK